MVRSVTILLTVSALFCTIQLSNSDLIHSVLRAPPQNAGSNRLAPSPRSWAPSTGALRFPATSNAGRLNYKLVDAARTTRAPRIASTTAAPKTILFPDILLLSSSNNRPKTSARVETQTGFRPSLSLPFVDDLSQDKNKRQNSNGSPVYLTAETAPAAAVFTKLPRFISSSSESNQERQLSASQSIETTASLPHLSPEYNDLIEALEQVVERLDTIDSKLSTSESEREAQRESSQSIIRDNVDLALANIKLEEDVGKLKEQMTSLEQRFGLLQEMVKEMLDPKVFAQDRLDGKSDDDRNLVAQCPDQFFSLSSDSSVRCYHISTIPNDRKNWRDASDSCKSIGAKLAEPQTSDELEKITDYLRFSRTDQLGGGYWTGGILNPGLLWTWPSSGRSLTNINPELWITSSDSSPTATDTGKCLRLSYDRDNQQYRLQGSDCQRYLYFICEYNENIVVTTSTAEPSTTRTITPSTTVATSTAASTTTAETKRTTSKPLTPAPPQAYFTREPNSTKITSTARVKVTRHPRPPVTPNYVGVIGFKDSPREEIAPAKNNNFGSLNLAILSDDIV